MLLDAERERGLLDHIPLSVLSRIKAMELQTAKICKDAMEFVRKDDEKYFEQMSYIIERPWMIFKKEKKINEKLRWDPKHYKKTSSSKYWFSLFILLRIHKYFFFSLSGSKVHCLKHWDENKENNGWGINIQNIYVCVQHLHSCGVY